MKEQIGKKRKKRKLSDEREELKGYLRGWRGQGMNETKGNKSKQPGRREKRGERERERSGENGDQSGAVYLVFAGVR